MIETINEIDNWKKLHITVCPVCGAERGPDYYRYAQHLETHDPEDFGLSPLRDDDERVPHGNR